MYSEVEIGKLVPSRLNPRRRINPKKLSELQASIAEHGIIEPLVVRKKGAKFEIICGGRRFKAATALALAEIPIIVRKLSDTAALELAVVENIQDEDLHPLDEAGAYKTLLEAKTIEEIGTRVGRTTSHIFRTLQFLKLTPPVRKAFAEDRITIRHAERLTRVPKKKQEGALEECFAPLFRSEHSEPAPVARLDQWIARNVKEELDGVAVVHVFPELLEQAGGNHPEDTIPEMVGLSDSYHAGSDLDDRKHGLVNGGAWAEIKTPKQRCENARQGVVLHGGPVRVVECCVKKGCKKHRPPRPKPTARAAAKQSKREKQSADAQAANERARKQWDRDKPKLLEAFVEHVAGAEVTPVLVEAFMGWQLESTTKLVGKVTKKNMGQAMATAVLMGGQTYDLKSFKKNASDFGFNTTKAMQAIARTRKAAKKTKKA